MACARTCRRRGGADGDGQRVHAGAGDKVARLRPPAKVITLGSNETIKQAVMAGMGISLLSLHTLSLELRTREIALLDVTSTPIERVWHVAHMEGKRLSPASESCRAYLLEHTAEFLGKEYAGLLPGRRVA